MGINTRLHRKFEEFGPGVSELKSFKGGGKDGRTDGQTDGRQTESDHNSSS